MFIYICVYIYILLCICIFIFRYLYFYINTCVCICIYLYICISFTTYSQYYAKYFLSYNISAVKTFKSFWMNTCIMSYQTFRVCNMCCVSVK